MIRPLAAVLAGIILATLGVVLLALALGLLEAPASQPTPSPALLWEV